MVLIPQNKKTTEYVVESKKFRGKRPRRYLGMSSLGNDCLRAQWYSWRWADIREISARLNRIFSYGHHEEEHIIRDLKEAGMEVFMVKENKEIEIYGLVGEEQEEIVGFHQHCMGHPDGRVRGVIEAPKTVHALEMKTMNDRNFQILKLSIFENGPEKGLRKSFPSYYDQTTRYMGGMNLTRGLFIATNKNDQARRYIRIHFDKKRFKILTEREENIILSENPPKKRYKASNYKCAFCNHHQICHLGSTIIKNCRTCMHGDILPEGKWGCGRTGKNISYSKQLRGCDNYKGLTNDRK